MQSLLRLPRVIEITGRPRSSIYEDIKKGAFPAPVKVSRRCVGWRSTDIAAWVESRTGKGKP